MSCNNVSQPPVSQLLLGNKWSQILSTHTVNISSHLSVFRSVGVTLVCMSPSCPWDQQASSNMFSRLWEKHRGLTPLAHFKSLLISHLLTNISLARTSHMGQPKVKEQRNRLYHLWRNCRVTWQKGLDTRRKVKLGPIMQSTRDLIFNARLMWMFTNLLIYHS